MIKDITGMIDIGLIRVFIGYILFFILFLSISKSYRYYHKRGIFEDIKNINIKTLLFIFPELHTNTKGKFWAKVFWGIWALFSIILALGLTFS